MLELIDGQESRHRIQDTVLNSWTTQSNYALEVENSRVPGEHHDFFELNDIDIEYARQALAKYRKRP